MNRQGGGNGGVQGKSGRGGGGGSNQARCGSGGNPGSQSDQGRGDNGGGDRVQANQPGSKVSDSGGQPEQSDSNGDSSDGSAEQVEVQVLVHKGEDPDVVAEGESDDEFYLANETAGSGPARQPAPGNTKEALIRSMSRAKEADSNKENGLKQAGSIPSRNKENGPKEAASITSRNKENRLKEAFSITSRNEEDVVQEASSIPSRNKENMSKEAVQDAELAVLLQGVHISPQGSEWSAGQRRVTKFGRKGSFSYVPACGGLSFHQIPSPVAASYRRGYQLTDDFPSAATPRVDQWPNAAWQQDEEGHGEADGKTQYRYLYVLTNKL